MPSPAVLLFPFLLLASCSQGLQCPSFGLGGDSELNRLKNRGGPPDSLRQMTAEEFLAVFPRDMHTPKEHDEFTQSERDTIEPLEKMGVAVTGYLVEAFKAFPELSNCLDPEDEDWHLNLYPFPANSSANTDSLVTHSIVTEVSPRWQDMKKGLWSLDTLKALAARRAKVRISGWVMYDPEHPDHLGRLRGTLWEVHPITEIEVWKDTAWVRLEDRPPARAASSQPVAAGAAWPQAYSFSRSF
jgi:hypothetical protein